MTIVFVIILAVLAVVARTNLCADADAVSDLDTGLHCATNADGCADDLMSVQNNVEGGWEGQYDFMRLEISQKSHLPYYKRHLNISPS